VRHTNYSTLNNQPENLENAGYEKAEGLIGLAAGVAAFVVYY